MFQKLEYKYGHLAIHNFNLYLATIYAIGLLIQIMNPIFYFQYLCLDTKALFNGQIWRIFTFIFFPPSGFLRSNIDILLAALIIYVYYNLTTILLQVWSDFKFNIYFFGGIIGHVLGGIIVSLITQNHMLIYPTYLTFSIFIAFALTFPETRFLLFFIIPIKAKYIAIVELALYAYMFIYSSLADRIALVMSLINVFFFLYFMYKDKLKYLFRRRNGRF
ncbi:MAG: hypothetical protein Q4F88_00115 [Eubacteriales bacterium]|nr:hypothetical protein [Eubacteriales bacterium]